MHGSIGASLTTATSNHVVVVVLNFATIALAFVEVQIQQLATIQVQAIAWKPHN
jgi:hypothetical protein